MKQFNDLLNGTWIVSEYVKTLKNKEIANPSYYLEYMIGSAVMGTVGPFRLKQPLILVCLQLKQKKTNQ